MEKIYQSEVEKDILYFFEQIVRTTKLARIKNGKLYPWL
jgi:hypothetical protein